VNFWKGNSDNGEFLRLVALVRGNVTRMPVSCFWSSITLFIAHCGSFPSIEGDAAGNRARNFQSLGLKSKLDSLTPLHIEFDALTLLHTPKSLTPMMEGEVAIRLAKGRGAINRSHASSNRVSESTTRILKIRDQRLAPEIQLASPEIEKNGRQRLAVVSITRGNVARIFASGT
jgi:hypothetical protein